MIARSIAIYFCALLGSLSCVVAAKADRPATDTIRTTGETGVASIYAYAGDKGAGGPKTASGEQMRPSDMSAAHKSLPFGTRVRVTNLRNGMSAVVRINDRGPFVKGRIIDLTPTAARSIGFSADKQGLARVELTVVTN
jgi:peptidoglycan lytic transglycosylase